MNAAPECDQVLLVQAELDGELDAAQAAALAAHRATCPICEAAAVELARARTLIAGELHSGLDQRMPEEVRGRVMAQIRAASALAPSQALPGKPGREGWWPRWWSAAAGFGLGGACAAALALLVLLPRQPNIVDDIVAGHIRALQPGHLEDVVSTDQHTVKPWFDGRIDFAPPVKDLAAERFPLRGGRLDYVGGRPVAALVYQHDKHLIDLYIWPAGTGAAHPPEVAARHGYNVVHWTQDGMALWAVSDLEVSLLREFAEDWRGSP
ncbi:MAG: anti-sigma factor [Stellaceae bacterium]